MSGHEGTIAATVEPTDVGPSPADPGGGSPMRSWASMLRTVRGPVAVLVLGVVGLLVPPQTQDMLAAIDGVWSTFAFNLALALLAFAAWFWGRALLAARFEASDAGAKRAAMVAAASSKDKATTSPSINPYAFVWLPRLLFIAAALIGITLLLFPFAFFHLAYVVVWAVFGFWVLVTRQRRPRLKNTPPPDAPPTPGKETGHAGTSPSWLARLWQSRLWQFWRNRIWHPLRRLLAYAPISSKLGWGLLITGLVIFLAGAIESFLPQPLLPEGWPGLAAFLAGGFPGPSIAVLGLGLMIGPLAALTFVADGFKLQWEFLGSRFGPRRPPVILILALWIFVVVPWFFESHTVRIFEPTPTHAAGLADPTARAPLQDMWTKWIECNGPGSGPLRPVIVAISGGATRAGLWGARVLEGVDDAAASPRPVIFAVSSVSGGSLGAAAYLALHGAATNKDGCVASLRPENKEAYLSLRQDALGPLLAGRLLGDLPRTLVTPFAALARHMPWSGDRQPRGGDSAEAMERGFEGLWRPEAKKRGVPGFDEAFLSLFYRPDGQPRRGMPIWLANGTDAATGNRMLTVPFNPYLGPGADGALDWPIRGARDTLGLLEADVQISTAINNTARFPFLEPFGTLLSKKDGKRVGALIDGGYFENEGLQTALDLADWLKDKDRGGKLPGRRVVEPIIVVATGDGERIDAGPIRCPPPGDGPTTRSTKNVLQMLAPLVGVYDVRGGHSTALLHQAREQYCSGNHRSFFHFYLPPINGKDVPLNWILSEKIAGGIWDALTRVPTSKEEFDPGNKEELDALKAALASH
jgi:hypothetical protein